MLELMNHNKFDKTYFILTIGGDTIHNYTIVYIYIYIYIYIDIIIN